MKIQDLDMAAAVIAATGEQPLLKDRITAGRIIFVFSDSEPVTNAVARYATDNLHLPAKKLLKIRGELYKMLRRGK